MGGIGSGGARARSGPAPDPGSANTARHLAEWTVLQPRDGVGIDVPDWPIPGDTPKESEWELWESLWLTKAQAAVWERDGAQMTVAAYVRTYLASLSGRMSSQMGTLAKQHGEALLLTPMSLRAAKCVVAGSADAAALASHAPERQTPPAGGARSRLTVVAPASGE